MNYATYGALVREAQALEKAGLSPSAGPRQLIAAAERIGKAWEATGWAGSTAGPEQRTISPQIYAAAVALHLQEEGHGPAQAESMVKANRLFIIEAQTEGAEPQTAAELAHRHLTEDGRLPPPQPSHRRPAQTSGRYS